MYREESAVQIKLRAQRLQEMTRNATCWGNSAGKYPGAGKEVKPSLLIIDSIQTIYSKH